MLIKGSCSEDWKLKCFKEEHTELILLFTKPRMQAAFSLVWRVKILKLRWYHKALSLLTFSTYFAGVVFGAAGIKETLSDSLSNLITKKQREEFQWTGRLEYELWDCIHTLFRSLKRAYLNQLSVEMRYCRSWKSTFTNSYDLHWSLIIIQLHLIKSKTSYF